MPIVSSSLNDDPAFIDPLLCFFIIIVHVLRMRESVSVQRGAQDPQ